MSSRQRQWQYTLFALFALSGFSGLIYESIWSHYLKLFLGHAAYAQTLVLAIFMGGMAGGAWLASRYMPRLKNPLLGYVLVELAIGVFGLLFHSLFQRVTGFMLDELLPGMESAAVIALLRWGTATLLILPQTLLLGATFPLMTAGILRCFPAAPGRSIALLYFSNSIGAVIGVLASGFWLINKVGLPGTIMTAALVNFLLALSVYGVALTLQSARPAKAPGATASALLRPLLLVSLITGLSSFIYEIGWIRMLSLVLGASTHAFELMLSAFILGLALGGLWIRRRIDGYHNPQQVLGLVQLLMAFFALLTVLGYNHMFDLMSIVMSALDKNDAGYLLFNFSSHFIAMLVMLPVTFMAGMTLPLITSMLYHDGEGEAAIGKVYAFNTLGAILGVWLTVQVLMPHFGLKLTIIAGVVLDVGLGLYLLVRARTGRSWQGLAVAVSLAAVIATLVLVQFDGRRMASGVFRHGHNLMEADIVFHKDGRTATVDVYDMDDGVLTISTNGKPDASAALRNHPPEADEPTMVLLGALPLLAMPEARTAAIIGIGSGISANVMLTSPKLEVLDVVEIEEAMVDGARLFGPFSERVFYDPRSHIHIDDAKSYFAAHNKRYDLILSEPSNPWVSGVSSLFTKEFYGRISGHLNDDGLLVQWFHVYETNRDVIGSIMKALSGNFSDYRIYAANNTDMVLIARKKGAVQGLGAAMFSDPAFSQVMKHVHWPSLQDVELHEIGNKQLLEPFFNISSAPVNSDFFPYVDRSAVAARFKKEGFTQLLELREGGIPLPGVNFDGHLRASDDVLPIEFFPREDALQARRLAHFLAHPQAQPLPALEERVSSALLVSMAKPGCSDARGQEIWRENLALLAKVMSPYLTAEEMQPALRYWRSMLCSSVESQASSGLLDLMAAVSLRDGGKIRTAASLYLGAGEIAGGGSHVYALHALLLGLSMTGDHAAVVDSLKRYRGTLTPVMELFLIHALADRNNAHAVH